MKLSSSAKMLAVFAAAVACIAAGCGVSACPKTALSREQLVRQYNANSAGVPRLWARVRIDMNLTDADGKNVQWGSSLGSPNGLLLLAKDGASQQPGFLLRGTMPGGNELFRMGASRSESLYYLWYNAGNNRRAWLGRTELAGAPGSVRFLCLPAAEVSREQRLEELFAEKESEENGLFHALSSRRNRPLSSLRSRLGEQDEVRS